MQNCTRFRFLAAALMVIGILFGVACSPGDPSGSGPPPGAVEVPPDEPMGRILSENITEYRPAGVTYDGKSESRADGYVPTNQVLWTFVGTTDDAVKAAASEMRDAAVTDGWTLDQDFSTGPGPGAGLYSAGLSKDAMRLVIRYVTETYMVAHGRNERTVSASIEYNPAWAHQDEE